MEIVKFNWDNHKESDYDSSGKHLIIGQRLKKLDNPNLTHLNIYGISLDIIDNSKDYRLKNLSCSTVNITGEVKAITKEEARKVLIEEIDKSLDILYNTGEFDFVAENLNILPNDDVEEDE